MREWVSSYREIRPDNIQFNWRFKGELMLDLECKGPPDADLGRPYFEMARILNQEYQAYMDGVDNPEFALECLKEEGKYIDCFWKGQSPEDLETFCKESLLPLPENYMQAWYIASGR